MAVKRSWNALQQQRVDIPHLRMIESAVRADFDDLLRAAGTGVARPFVLNGFEVSYSGAVIGAPATSLQVVVDGGVLFHSTATESGTLLAVTPGAANETLGSSNPKVSGAFIASSSNFVAIDYSRAPDDTTKDLVKFLDPDSQREFDKVVPLSETLDYKFVVATSGFGTLLPLAVVVTDASNNVVSVTDARPMMFRLGRGGAVPDPSYTFAWPEGRVENPSTSTGAANPFFGGDKALACEKDWKDAVMSRLQELSGEETWFGSGPFSLVSLDRFFKPVPAATPDLTFSIYPSQSVMGGKRRYAYLEAGISSEFPRVAYSSGAYDGGANDDRLTVVDFAISAGNVEVGATLPSVARFVLDSAPVAGGWANTYTPVLISVSPTDDTLVVTFGSHFATLALAEEDANLPTNTTGTYPVAVAVVHVDAGGTTIDQAIDAARLVDRRPANGGGGGGGSGAGPGNYDAATATAGQTVFNLAFSYTIGGHMLRVVENGVELAVGLDYTENTTTQVTLTHPATAGDYYKFTTGPVSGGSSSGVLGPAASTDNAVPRWNGTSGHVIKDSGVTIDDFDNVSVGGLSVRQTDLGTGVFAYLTSNDCIVKVSDGSSPTTVTLSDADKAKRGLMVVKDVSGVVGSSGNPITVQAETGAIDGAPSIPITVDYGVLRLFSDGANWWSI